MRAAAVAAVAVLVFLLLPSSAGADGAWLDQQPPVQWNSPGMSIPQAPPLDPNTNPRCSDSGRPADTDEDEELIKAGWYLVGSYVGGWDVLVIGAASGFDGMCRPLGYNEFVFHNGIYAGTVSPVLMDSRTDGAAGMVAIEADGILTVQFSRYVESDPLCCPSRTSFARYEIDPRGGRPVLTLVSVFTQSTDD